MAYIDDIIVYSKNFEDHLRHLNLIFERLKQFNVQVKPSKCLLFKQEVLYLGHIVSREGIKVNPEKIEVIRTMPPPKNVKGVRSFLGVTGYFRRFIKGYGELAEPLIKLTRKNNRFLWTNECNNAFIALKEKLCQRVLSPILI